MANSADPYLQMESGFHIEEPADMLDFFKTDELDTIDPFMEELLGSTLDEDGNLRLEDTEFAGQFWHNFRSEMTKETSVQKYTAIPNYPFTSIQP